jgi:hypothetical protein
MRSGEKEHRPKRRNAGRFFARIAEKSGPGEKWEKRLAIRILL